MQQEARSQLSYNQHSHFAQKRLMKDYMEVLRNPLPTVSAEPISLFEWHCNLKAPEKSIYEGLIFHVVMHFPPNYPSSPPRVELKNTLDHPHVFEKWICLDLLETHHEDNRAGWSSCYSVQSILLQLQSFFFNHELRWDVFNVQRTRASCREFECSCGHNFLTPRPQFTIGTLQMDKMEDEELQLLLSANESKLPPFPAEIWNHIFKWMPIADLRIMENSCSVLRTKVAKSDDVQVRKEIVCFHTRMNFDQALLGFGLNVVYKSGTPFSASSPLDIISFFAYEKEALRLGAWKESFQFFFPLYISKRHGKASIPYLKYCISKIYSQQFKPKLALDLLSKLMNSMIVTIMKGQMHASLKALDGYISFHRLLIALVQEFPEMRRHVDEIVEKFISDDKYRRKAHVPSMGEFLTYLTVSKYKWEDIGIFVLQEIFCRNVLWVSQQFQGFSTPYHGKLKTSVIQTRLHNFFKGCEVSLRLIMFHVYFLKNFAPRKGESLEEIALRYDERYGFASPEQKSDFQKEVFRIFNVTSLEGCFSRCYFKVNSPMPENVLLKIIDNAILRSSALGYHGK